MEAEKRGGKESVASIGATGTGIGTGAVTDRKEEQLSKPVANPEPDSIQLEDITSDVEEN